MLTMKHTKALGFRERNSGTTYLRDAVNYILEQPPEERPRLTREVYPAVAEKHGKSVHAIERAIRHTICRSDSDAFYGTNGDVIWELVQRCRDGVFTA